MDKKIKEEICKAYYNPRSGKEIQKAVRGGCGLYLYSDLCDMMKKKGAVPTLEWMFLKHLKNVILLQDPKDMNTGHWTSLSLDPKRHAIYFFSSYGGKPDAEKNEWISPSGRVISRQDVNLFNDGLRDLLKYYHWQIHYNEVPYQIDGDNSATCGIWCTAFLNSNLNPTEFYRYSKDNRLTFFDYYLAYF